MAALHESAHPMKEKKRVESETTDQHQGEIDGATGLELRDTPREAECEKRESKTPGGRAGVVGQAQEIRGEDEGREGAIHNRPAPSDAMCSLIRSSIHSAMRVPN